MDYDYDELMCISAELLAEQAAAGELSDDTLRRIGHLSRFCKCLASAAPNGGKQWSLASAFAAQSLDARHRCSVDVGQPTSVLGRHATFCTRMMKLLNAARVREQVS